jgi:hypothetical protein
MANWFNFTDLESGIAYYEYYFGRNCITAVDYCGSQQCVGVGGTCVESLFCSNLINRTLAAAFRSTRGYHARIAIV